jgi:hypothetical protein
MAQGWRAVSVTPETLISRSAEDSLAFDQSDLMLADDFENCTTPGTPYAQRFLAGQSTFRPDTVEVWGFFTSDESPNSTRISLSGRV